jgi:hypothetical protein
MNEKSKVKTREEVVLSKYHGEGTSPEQEFERITVLNGYVTGHDVVLNGEVISPVEPKDNLVGRHIGELIPKEVN